MCYFERCLPETQGVSSADILRFLQEAKQNQCHIHAFLLLRHGKVIAEGYQYPYTSEDKRLLYSVSKTFTAMGIGIAISEGRLSLEDKVISFFPEALPENIGEKLRKLNIYHLLTMSTGHASDSLYEICKHTDWISAFLNMEIQNEPGDKFQYDSGASFMLSAIITRVTGMPLDEYLRIKLFEPLHIDDYVWDRYHGITTGGWGLMLKPEDIAKVGILFLGKGCFEGKRILSEEWIDLATKKQIDTEEKEFRPDWAQGYGFQMWRCVGDGFRADGAFGQFCLVYPQEELVLSLTSEDGYSQELLTAFYDNIVKKAHNLAIMTDTFVFDRLSVMLCDMEVPFTYAATASYLEKRIHDKRYLLKNEIGGQNREVSFHFAGSSLTMTIAGSQKICSSKVTCRIDEMYGVLEPVTVIPMHEQKARKWKYAAHHYWVNDTVLMIEICYIETGHVQQIMAQFIQDKLYMTVINGCKKLLQINGMESSQGMEFADVLLEGQSL